MDVITALFLVANEDEILMLREQLALSRRAQLEYRHTDTEELIRALEEIAVGDYPEAVKGVILPQLTALREMKGFGLIGYGTFKKGDDEPAG